MRRALVFFSCFTVARGLTAQDVRRYAPSEAAAVIGELHGLLVANHPLAFRMDARAQLDSVHERIDRALADRAPGDSLTRGDILRTAAPFGAVLQDGHFRFRATASVAFREGELEHHYRLPIRQDDRDRLLLTDSLPLRSGAVLPKGAELTHLDGRVARDLLSEVAALDGGDDHGYRRGREFIASQNLALYHQLVNGLRDSLPAAFQVRADTVTVTLFPAARVAETSAQRSSSHSRRRTKQAALAAQIYLDTTARPSVRRLVVKSFEHDAYAGANPRRRFRELFAQLEREGVTALIIDLRYNRGGRVEAVDELFGYLAREPYHLADAMTAGTRDALGATAFKRLGARALNGARGGRGRYRMMAYTRPQAPHRRHHFDGEVVVLVSPITFSGGTALAHYVQHYDRGRVVGRVPGGSAERMYAGTKLETVIGPDGAFRMTVPRWQLDMVGETRGNLMPDVLVEATEAALMDGGPDYVGTALGLFAEAGPKQ